MTKMLQTNNIKRFISEETNVTLVPCDRRKIKKLKRKNLAIKYGQVGPYWTCFTRGIYYWKWKYFNTNIKLSDETIYFCKKFIKKEHRDRIKGHVEFGMSPKQHPDNMFFYNIHAIKHDLTNDAYLFFKNSKEIAKWKLKN